MSSTPPIEDLIKDSLQPVHASLEDTEEVLSEKLRQNRERAEYLKGEIQRCDALVAKHDRRAVFWMHIALVLSVIGGLATIASIILRAMRHHP